VRIDTQHAIAHNKVMVIDGATGYVAPVDKWASHETEIFAARDRKLAEAREGRKVQRQASRSSAGIRPSGGCLLGRSTLR
jgi:hypothetical protein